ncbi:MAG TPA: response regulator [Candidatus Aminicenantes bacterium]|nr:response regulator [Candidatus Aminicenantes bacterium]HPB55219.1 response regulator [Candidatus Aminicenantes bacterium]HPS99716.1 response regulator [Candidatus Aminicenantes bacterium]
MKFLVVDDSLTMRRIIKNSLQKLGFADVSEASNGLEALEEIGKGGINIVLTDWNMPEMDGMTFVTKLRQQDAQIPILMITTNAAKEDVLEAFKAGISDYIIKPFTPEVLKEKIEGVLKG